MLLHCVAGLSDPIHGKVLLDGASPTTFGWPGFRRRVLLAFQQPVLFEETVQEALERPFHYRVSNFPFPRERARELLNRLGIESTRFDQPALSLSIGQQQRVCLVRALLLNPDYLLLDEPTSALDDESVVAVEALLKERAVSDQLGIVMVTHARKQVDRMCDRSLSLDKHVVTQ